MPSVAVTLTILSFVTIIMSPHCHQRISNISMTYASFDHMASLSQHTVLYTWLLLLLLLLTHALPYFIPHV